MDFKYGDKIILKTESVINAIKMGYTEAFVKEIMAVIAFESNSYYIKHISSDWQKNLPLGGILKYRLATERELKLNKIKKMFINE
jgi:hypothetical protein